MNETKYYDKAFYQEQQDGSLISARKVLPIVNDIFHPKSVADIGCGVGYWLKVWDEIGVKELIGVEGDYMNSDLFLVDKMYLKTADLKEPVNLGKKYDLVMSLEVAEHIPESSSDVFVKNLVNVGDIVLFSAAIKGQIGTYHINEQMPEYWAEKFMKHNYVPVDMIRPLIWNNTEIQYWYRQNIILFVNKEKLNQYPSLQAVASATDPGFLLRIHPEKYFAYVNHANDLETFSGFLKFKLYQLKKWLKRSK